MSEYDKTAERLAALEAKLEFVKELLKEIRDEVKDQPSKEDYERLEERVSILEKSYTSLAVKVAGTAAAVTVIVQLLALFFRK